MILETRTIAPPIQLRRHPHNQCGELCSCSVEPDFATEGADQFTGTAVSLTRWVLPAGQSARFAQRAPQRQAQFSSVRAQV